MTSKAPRPRSKLSRQLAEIRGSQASRKRLFKVTPETQVTDPEFHTLAHEAARDALSAFKIRAEKVDWKALAILRTNHPLDYAKMMADLEELLGQGAVVLGDKLLWMEVDHGIRLRSAEMTIDRVQPMPHRVDSGKKSKYQILRVDPNKRELVLEEVAGPNPPAHSAKDEPL